MSLLVYPCSWLSPFLCSHILMKNMVNLPPLLQLPPPKACSVCKGRLVDRSDEDGIECTIVSSESFDTDVHIYSKIVCIQGLQGHAPCQFCIPRWGQNLYPDIQRDREVWHRPSHSQLWIHHEVLQDDLL